MTPVESEQPRERGTDFAFTVGDEEVGARLDRFLAAREEIVAAHISRTRVKTLIEQGAASVRGRAAGDANLRLAAGDEVTLRVPPAEPAEPEGEAIALNIVFEDRISSSSISRRDSSCIPPAAMKPARWSTR